MKSGFNVVLLMLVLLLPACGGSSTSESTPVPVPVPNVPSVNSVDVVPKFANKTLITVKGNYLLNAISGTATGACSTLTEEPNSTDSQVVYSCTPQKTGIGALAISIVAKANNGLLQAKNIDVLEPQVTMVTAQGTIVVELNPTAAPLSVNNFLNYVNSNFYTNTLFHRIIKGFVVQGGGVYQYGVTKDGECISRHGSPCNNRLI